MQTQTIKEDFFFFSLRYTMPSSLIWVLFSFDTHLCYWSWPSTPCAAGGLKSRPEFGIPLHCAYPWVCHHVRFVKFVSLCKVCLCLSGTGQCSWFMSAFVRLSLRLSWLNNSPLFIHVVRYGANSCTVRKIFLLPSALTWRYQTQRLCSSIWRQLWRGCELKLTLYLKYLPPN